MGLNECLDKINREIESAMAPVRAREERARQIETKKRVANEERARQESLRYQEISNQKQSYLQGLNKIVEAEMKAKNVPGFFTRRGILRKLDQQKYALTVTYPLGYEAIRKEEKEERRREKEERRIAMLPSSPKEEEDYRYKVTPYVPEIRSDSWD